MSKQVKCDETLLPTVYWSVSSTKT